MPKVKISKGKTIAGIDVPSAPKSAFDKPELSEPKFRFITIYPWTKGTDTFYKTNGFTNLCKNSEEYACFITTVLEDIIPTINDNYKEIFLEFNNQFKHCHQLDKDSIALAKKISQELTQIDFTKKTEDSDYTWWQVGLKESTRIIGIFSRNELVFYPIFVDWHHLMFEDKNYNQKDFAKYRYCPHKKTQKSRSRKN